MRSLPFLGLAGARLIGRTPDGIAVLDVGIKSAAVGRQVEEAVVVDAPDLRGFIPRNAAACLLVSAVVGYVRSRTLKNYVASLEKAA